MNTSRNIAKWLAIFEEDIVFVVHGEGSGCCLMEKTCSISKANKQIDSDGHFAITDSGICLPRGHINNQSINHSVNQRTDPPIIPLIRKSIMLFT